MPAEAAKWTVLPDVLSGNYRQRVVQDACVPAAVLNVLDFAGLQAYAEKLAATVYERNLTQGAHLRDLKAELQHLVGRAFTIHHCDCNGGVGVHRQVVNLLTMGKPVALGFKPPRRAAFGHAVVACGYREGYILALDSRGYRADLHNGCTLLGDLTKVDELLWIEAKRGQESVPPSVSDLGGLAGADDAQNAGRRGFLDVCACTLCDQERTRLCITRHCPPSSGLNRSVFDMWYASFGSFAHAFAEIVRLFGRDDVGMYVVEDVCAKTVRGAVLSEDFAEPGHDGTYAHYVCTAADAQQAGYATRVYRHLCQRLEPGAYLVSAVDASQEHAAKFHESFFGKLPQDTWRRFPSTGRGMPPVFPSRFRDVDGVAAYYIYRAEGSGPGSEAGARKRWAELTPETAGLRNRGKLLRSVLPVTDAPPPLADCGDGSQAEKMTTSEQNAGAGEVRASEKASEPGVVPHSVEWCMDRLGLEPNVVTYNATISACVKGLQWAKALELLASMDRRGLEPDVETYNATISACVKGLQWAKALELLASMDRRGLVPTVVTYSAAISACEKGLQWAKAVELLASMDRRGLVPTVVTYSAATSACQNGMQWQKAVELQASNDRARRAASRLVGRPSGEHGSADGSCVLAAGSRILVGSRVIVSVNRRPSKGVVLGWCQGKRPCFAQTNGRVHVRLDDQPEMVHALPSNVRLDHAHPV